MREQPALDVVVQGAGGVMSVTGAPGGPPARPGLSLADLAAGLYGAIGILAALRERESSGLGQFVDISMLDCQIAIQGNAFMRYHLTGEPPQALAMRTAIAFLRASLTSTTVSIIRLGAPHSRAVRTRASVSFGKHEPP